MFVKTTTSGPRQYVKLVESYRDTAGVPRQRVILTLGRLESVRSGEADSLLNGLLRAAGKPSLEEGTGEVAFAPALSVGDTWLLTALWKELGFADAFRRLLRNRHPFDAERLLRVRVLNRLCDPESKLGILRRLEGTRVPDVSAESVNHHHLLRTMDTLTEDADRVDDALAGLLRPLIDQELAIVFYDLTTIRAEGGSDESKDLRHFGRAKEGGTIRQGMLGVVQTAEGLPIHHEVFAGHTGETTTLVPTIEKVLARYPIRRVVLVADRGLLSLDHLDAIRALRVRDQPLEFILAVPAWRYGDFDSLLAPFHEKSCQSATKEVFGEMKWQGFRLIVAHRPDRASEQGRVRDERIAALEADAAQWAEKLDAQDAGRTPPGRKLSDPGTTARFYKAVADAHLANIIQVDLASEVFSYAIDERALERARLIDGKLILVSNVPGSPPAEIVARYKALADIERGFRVLKSEIEIAPVFHRLPDRIRAHALICFLALLLYRVLRLRLKAKASPISPERALEIARRIQYHQITLHQRQSASGLSAMTPQQKELFQTIALPEPSARRL
ncbi:IS1634 family transposase [Accumulibacter sp.]|uniref:IS1634 family transposase n=1 Tax=Accumulibacter sp. TaxID=2053492 RepID=UPI001A58DD9A|nr:IS1634 family transposase [Accumulibacter sp.]MBL8400111.1 IS1634 family transposase [Accumulibacter sp.]